jgi:hypothetical protein
MTIIDMWYDQEALCDSVVSSYPQGSATSKKPKVTTLIPIFNFNKFIYLRLAVCVNMFNLEAPIYEMILRVNFCTCLCLDIESSSYALDTRACDSHDFARDFARWAGLLFRIIHHPVHDRDTNLC